MRRPTIKDVAARAQVSLKTVSRVINDEPSVQARTRERVQQAIADLGYQPDPSARSLRSAQSYAIGLLYDNPNPYYVIAVQNGVLSVCRETGYGLQIHPCDSTSPHLAREIIDLVQRARLAGLVLAPPMSERQELIDELAAQNIRLVRIVSAAADPQDGSACIYVDDRDAAYEITEYLIQLGHSRIGFLWGGKSHGSSWERYKGYEEALRDYGIALDADLVVEGDYSFDDGFRGARRLLDAGRSPHRDLRQQRRDRRRRARRRQVQRHERAVRPVDCRLRGQPVLQAELAGADHGQAGHRGDRPARRATACCRKSASNRARRCPTKASARSWWSAVPRHRPSPSPAQGLSETSSCADRVGAIDPEPSLSRVTNAAPVFLCPARASARSPWRPP